MSGNPIMYGTPRKQWAEGLCGCLSNIPMCLLGYFCFPCLTNHVSWRLDGGIFVYLTIYLFIQSFSFLSTNRIQNIFRKYWKIQSYFYRLFFNFHPFLNLLLLNPIFSKLILIGGDEVPCPMLCYCCSNPVKNRLQAKKTFGIEGESFCDSCLIACCCTLCSEVQIASELDRQKCQQSKIHTM